MGAPSDLVAHTVLTWRLQTSIPSGRLYLGLYLTEVGRSLTGVEVSRTGTGYLPAQFATSLLGYSIFPQRQRQSNNYITFADPILAWGKPTWFGVFTTQGIPTPADLIGAGPILNPTEILAGSKGPRVPIGALKVAIRDR